MELTILFWGSVIVTLLVWCIYLTLNNVLKQQNIDYLNEHCRLTDELIGNYEDQMKNYDRAIKRLEKLKTLNDEYIGKQQEYIDILKKELKKYDNNID